VDVRGGAPGTRETDLLDPVNMVEKVHAIFLAGGSAFGLDSAGGVMKYLEENGIGFDAGVTKVPIVSGAVLFDLTCKDYKIRPDKEMGYEACLNAGNFIEEGSIGAGTGATVGKVFGMDKAMKGGLGEVFIQTGDLVVGAVVAVNCLGDVVDEENRIIAGAYEKDPFRFINSEQAIIDSYKDGLNPFSGNTTIGCVLTNAILTKAQAKKTSSIAHNGYARSIRPSHTMFDGDTIFTLSTGEVKADINVVGVLAARAVQKAVINGVMKARGLAGFPSYSDILY
jgi:L-aminopeptidase/D-esterase-like protein